MASTIFHPYDQIRSVFEQVLAASPADETELVWFEHLHGVTSYPDAESYSDHTADYVEEPQLTVLVRVVEGRRQGWHRTEIADASQLESGLRQALALAKIQKKVRRSPVFPTDTRELEFQHPLFDRRISELDPESAKELLREWCGDATRGRLSWTATRLAVVNSHGLRRRSDATQVTLEAACGGGACSGRAAGSARTLDDLHPEEVCRRARECSASGELGELPGGALPVLLAPEATAELLNVLNTFAFSSRAYLDGTSFLARHRNDQVFARHLNLRDDGTRVPGVPFPFDFEGSPKKPLDVIVKGRPATPALNLFQGAQAGLKPTAQAVGGQDSLFGHLYLLPGESSEEELLAAADGGLRIGWLDPPECDEPAQLRIRTTARCVRRIEGGRPGAPLPDLMWEESLLSALARLQAIGRHPVVRTTPTTILGAITAPAVVLGESDGFRLKS
ncbi:MAG: metallopeptidase TldD-related protein [Thermoanaerobaculia bacterium]